MICHLSLEYTAHFHFVMYNNACHILKYFLLHSPMEKKHVYMCIYIYTYSYWNASLNKIWSLLRKFIWLDLFSHNKSDRIIINLCHIIIQFSSVTQSCLTVCDPMDCNMPGLPVHHQLPEFTQAHVHWVGDAIQPSHHFLLPPSILPNIRVFSNESVLRITWPKYWSFSFSLSPSNEYSGQIFFRMDWLDLLAVQGTLKSLLQHHSSTASILQCSAFFIVQLSHPWWLLEKL